MLQPARFVVDQKLALSVLSIIRGRIELPVIALAAISGLSPSSLDEVLDHLEDQGLVYRFELADDDGVIIPGMIIRLRRWVEGNYRVHRVQTGGEVDHL